MNFKRACIFFTGCVLGLLISSQYFSYGKIAEIVVTARNENVFSEIQLQKLTNESLRTEIASLEEHIDQSTDRLSSKNEILSEIERKRLISGDIDVSGPGVVLTVQASLREEWLTDIVNELFSAGAEAISLNDIRLTPETSGFRSILPGQILFADVVIQTPYEFRAIGDKKILFKSLWQAGGIIFRLKMAYPGLSVDLATQDDILMKAI